MSTINPHSISIVDDSVSSTIENDDEKRVQELLEKQQLEKQQREKILEQLAMKNAEHVQKNMHELDQVFQQSKLLYTNHKDSVSMYKKNMDNHYLKVEIQRLTQLIEHSIKNQLMNQQLATRKKTNRLSVSKQTDASLTQSLSTLSSPTPTINANLDIMANQQAQANIKQLKHSLKTGKTTAKAVAQHYVASVFNLNPIQKNAANHDASTKKSYTISKADMIALGASESDIDSLVSISQSIIQNAMKKSIKQNLKQLVIQGFLSAINNKTVSDTMNAKVLESSYISVVNSLKSSRKLGQPDEIDTMHASILDEAKDEVLYALQTIVKQHTSDSNTSGQSSDPKHLQDQLLENAKKLGVITDQNNPLFDKTTAIDLFDLGHMILDFGDSDHSNESDHHSHAYQYTQDDESNIILDRIRANLMHLAISGSFMAGLMAQFKLFFDKRTGIKLGVYNTETERMLTTQANHQAIQKLQAMLDEALLEKASFHTESGTDWENNNQKIKSVIRNLQRLGVPISTHNLSIRILRANRALYPIVELECASIYGMLDDANFPPSVRHALMERLAQLQRVLARITSTEPGHRQSETGHIRPDMYRSICTNV